MEEPKGLLVQLVQDLMCLNCAAHLAVEVKQIVGQIMVDLGNSLANSLVLPI